MSEKIGEYEIIRTLYRSQHSECYVCRKNKQLLGYLLKTQNNMKEIAEHEHMISQTIETCSADSIIVPMIDSVEHQGKFYAVMQYRENGMFLSEVLQQLEERERKITIEEVCSLFIELIEKLRKLHECLKEPNGSGGQIENIGYTVQGILHGDLHPGNIFLESCNISGEIIAWGNLKFTDFENSRIIRDDGTIVQTQFEMGFTNGYFAPETRLLTKNKLSKGCDFYSVAAIMARILTGKSVEHQFISYMDILDRFVEDGGMLHQNPIIHEYLLRIIGLGLEIEPAYRIQTESEFRTMLMKLETLNYAVQELDYYEILKCAYNMNIGENACGKMIFHPVKYGLAVQKLSDGMLQDRTMAHMHLWIYRILCDMGITHRGAVDQSDWAYLLLSGVAIFNHHGRSQDAIDCYEQLYPLRQFLRGDDWYIANNRVCVCYADMFQHDKAMEISKNNIVRLEKIKRVYAENMDVTEEEVTYMLLNLARSYSAYGSYLAYEGNSECMEYFEKALKEFGNDIKNRGITISHILHYAIQNNDKLLYAKYYGMLNNIELQNERELDLYLRSNNEVEIFLNTSPEKRDIFGLYLYLKTIHHFNLYKDIPQLKDSLRKLLDDKDFVSEKDFPIPLVLKHCGELWWIMDHKIMTKEAKKFFQMALFSIEREHARNEKGMNIMKVISYSIESSMLLKEGVVEKNRFLYQGFLNRLKKEGIMLQLHDELEKLNSADVENPQIALKYEYT